MIALAVAFRAMGCISMLYEMPQTRAQYAANPDRALRQAGLWYPPDSPERKLFEDRLANTEPMATFALTNSLAGVSGAVAGGAGGNRSAGRLRNRKRLLAMLSVLIPIAACLLLTKSRSGYAGACVGMLCVWVLCRPADDFASDWKLPGRCASVAACLRRWWFRRR